MTREEAITRLKKAQEDKDKESAHIEADDVITEFLYSIGEYEIVNEWDKVGKWYA